MKKYKIECNRTPSAVEDEFGEWVRWEDMEEEISEAFKRGLNCRTIAVIDAPPISECICEKIVKRIPLESKYPEFWICPAHGYKRR